MKSERPTQESIARERAAQKGYRLEREPSGLIGIYGADDDRRYAGVVSFGYASQWVKRRRPAGTEVRG